MQFHECITYITLFTIMYIWKKQYWQNLSIQQESILWQGSVNIIKISYTYSDIIGICFIHNLCNPLFKPIWITCKILTINSCKIMNNCTTALLTPYYQNLYNFTNPIGSLLRSSCSMIQQKPECWYLIVTSHCVIATLCLSSEIGD